MYLYLGFDGFNVNSVIDFYTLFSTDYKRFDDI